MAIIGIDLGTTNSLACYWENEKVNMIPQNAKVENYIIPSQVYCDEDGSFVVGNEIKDMDMSTYNGENFFYSFKNFMGTDKVYMVGEESYTPVDFSAMILKKIKENAEAYLNEEISEAIISVPAYFNDRQRSDTKKAARLAGLKVERLINEPSAAALEYHMNSEGEMQNLIVFDFGGGTLDISLVECFENITEIVAIVGDNHLGGNDIDTCIAREWCAVRNIVFDELLANERYSVLMEAERFKCGEESSIDITEDRLFEICSPLFSKMKRLFCRLLKDSDHYLEEIDDVIMVGGSSKWKMVQKFISEIAEREPVVVEHPEYAVAKGVGIYTGIRNRNEDIKDLVLTDVCPFTLGTSVVNTDQHGKHIGKHMYPMIERNTTLPASRTERFYTVSDYQHLISFEVYQGEEFDVSKNILLGKKTVEIPMKKTGEVYVDVTFNYDINGIIHVIIRQDDMEEEMIISNHEMSEKEIEERIKKLRMLSIEDKDKVVLQKMIHILEEMYSEEHGKMRDRLARIIMNSMSMLSSGHIIERKKYISRLYAFIEEEYGGNLEDIEYSKDE